MPKNSGQLSCIECDATYDPLLVRYACDCGGQLELRHDASAFAMRGLFEARTTSLKDIDLSGVWRFREAVLPCDESTIVSHPEGGTRLYSRDHLTRAGDVRVLSFKHEGENPTGSFKDRGMTVAVTQARRVGARWLACASTGNTSASLAAYAAQAGLPAVVFIPAGKISVGKLAQTLAYGALCVAIRGDFDDAMRLVQDSASKLGAYLVNSLNPFRIEGQKTIIWEMLAQRSWQAPDWIVVPAGNLGNTSAFGKALLEAKNARWISHMPRILAVQAAGANPFAKSYRTGFKERFSVQAETIATAIRIGDPVNYPRAKRVINGTQGIVMEVSDDEIMHAKRMIDRAGLGCEPASAATLAGLSKARASNLIGRDADVVAVLTGHVLKDPDAVLKDFNSSTGQRLPVGKIHEIDPSLSALENLLAQEKVPL